LLTSLNINEIEIFSGCSNVQKHKYKKRFNNKHRIDTFGEIDQHLTIFLIEIFNGRLNSLCKGQIWQPNGSTSNTGQIVVLLVKIVHQCHNIFTKVLMEVASEL
jgi:hypothetical protein